MSRTLLVQAYQRFWLVKSNGVYERFTSVGRTRSSLAPLRLTLADSAVPHGSAYRFLGGYIVPRASHGVVADFACLGRERLMEQPVSSKHPVS